MLHSWRIYRLPGSREIWHIDAGPGTSVFNVRKYLAEHSYSVDKPNENPRAWIQIDNQEFHIVDGVARFSTPVVQSEIESELVEPPNSGGKANC